MNKGMEILIGQIVRSLGINPADLMGKVSEFIGFAKSCDERLKRIEDTQAKLLAALETKKDAA